MGTSERPAIDDHAFMVPEALRSDLLKVALETSLVTREWYDTPAGARKPVPWRMRLRWKLGYWRESAAELAYRLISGHGVPEREW